MSLDVDHDDNRYDHFENILESNDGADADLKRLADEGKDRGNFFKEHLGNKPSNIKVEEVDKRYYTVPEVLQSNDRVYVNQMMFAYRDEGNTILKETQENKPSNVNEEEGEDRYYTVQEVHESNNGASVNQTMIGIQDEVRGNNFKEQPESESSNIKKEEVKDRNYTVQEVHESNDGASLNQTIIGIQGEDWRNILKEEPENICLNGEENNDITDIYDVRPIDNKCQDNSKEGQRSPEKTTPGRTSYIVNNDLYGKFIYDKDKIRGRLPPEIPDNASRIKTTYVSKVGSPVNISKDLSQGSANHLTKESGSSEISEECAPVNPGEDHSDPTRKDVLSNMNDFKNDNIQGRGMLEIHYGNATQGCSNPIAYVNIINVESLPEARIYRTKNRLLKVVTAIRAIEPSSLKWLGSLMITGAFLVLAFEILILCYNCGLNMYIGIWVSGLLLVTGPLQLRLSRNTKTIGSTYILVTIIALCLSLTALFVGFCLSLTLRFSPASQMCGEIAVLLVYAVSLNLVPVLYSVFYIFSHAFGKNK